MMTTMPELKPCPFCGGNGRVTFDCKPSVDYNNPANGAMKHSVQISCEDCGACSSGVEINELQNVNPLASKWGIYVFNPLNQYQLRQTAMLEPFVNQAIKAWNKRSVIIGNKKVAHRSYRIKRWARLRSTDPVGVLKAKLEAARKERDFALLTLKAFAPCCVTCANYEDDEFLTEPCFDCENQSNWKWRGMEGD